MAPTRTRTDDVSEPVTARAAPEEAPPPEVPPPEVPPPGMVTVVEKVFETPALSTQVADTVTAPVDPAGSVTVEVAPPELSVVAEPSEVEPDVNVTVLAGLHPDTVRGTE